MSEEKSEAAQPLPAVPYLKLPEGGDPYLEGHECGSCGSIFLGERSVCSKCGARDSRSTPVRSLRTTGTLYAYSIVHRSFPGIEVPYISAIVDLEGGGTVKGNLIGIDPEPGEDRVRHARRGGLQGRPGPQGSKRATPT